MQPVITEMDERRLRSLLVTPVARRTPLASALLQRKLEQARIVPASAVPKMLVTMNSRVTCHSLATRRDRDLTLVYPWAACPEAGRIPVLSEAGLALLAGVPGTAFTLDGQEWRVVLVNYQPEAAGSVYL